MAVVVRRRVTTFCTMSSSPPAYITEKGTKSFSLSSDNAQDKNV